MLRLRSDILRAPLESTFAGAHISQLIEREPSRALVATMAHDA